MFRKPVAACVPVPVRTYELSRITLKKAKESLSLPCPKESNAALQALHYFEKQPRILPALCFGAHFRSDHLYR